MKKINFFTVIFLCLTFLGNAQSKITGIEAKLFYNQNKDYNGEAITGTFSENILNGDFALWNTIIGEGSAKGVSTQTIVIAEVTSVGLSNKRQYLKFTASSGKKILQQQQLSFDCIGDNVKYKLLFLLNGTGCGKLNIKCDLVSAGKVVSSKNKTIDFECGE